jgi:hypothetical protein
MKKVTSYCRLCLHDTNHELVAEKSKSSDPHDYPERVSYQIVECLGCETISFRQVSFDYGAAYPSSNYEGEEEWIVPEDISIFPKFIKNHNSLERWALPKIVRTIYQELLEAFRGNEKVLSGLGLRATVESVCNDLNIDGRNLETRINKLATNGYISKKDAERLHGIRFMGNDAAHEIKLPSSESLSVALKIVEHLLSSVYILEKEIEGNIEVSISDYLRFEKLLESNLSKYKISDEYPLAAYLRKDIRRVSASITVLESELINKIKSGEYKKLGLGKVDNYQGSKEKLQHYIILEKVSETLPPEDDF